MFEILNNFSSFVSLKIDTMTLTDFFWGLGDIFQWTFQIFEYIGNMVNYFFLIVLGFGGLFYWLSWQKKFNAEAENDPNVIK